MIVPLVITSFFECGGTAIVGEGQGGLRGAIIGTAVASVAMVGLVGVSGVLMSGTIRNWILIFGGNDLSLWSIIAKFVGQLLDWSQYLRQILRDIQNRVYLPQLK